MSTTNTEQAKVDHMRSKLMKLSKREVVEWMLETMEEILDLQRRVYALEAADADHFLRQIAPEGHA